MQAAAPVQTVPPTPTIQTTQPLNMAEGGPATPIGQKIAEAVPSQFETSKNRVGVVGIFLLALTGLTMIVSIRHHRLAYKSLKEKKSTIDVELAEVKVNLKKTMQELGLSYTDLGKKA